MKKGGGNQVQLSVRVPKRLDKKIEEKVQKGYFSSKSAVIRSILRERLLAY